MDDANSTNLPIQYLESKIGKLNSLEKMSLTNACMKSTNTPLYIQEWIGETGLEKVGNARDIAYAIERASEKRINLKSCLTPYLNAGCDLSQAFELIQFRRDFNADTISFVRDHSNFEDDEDKNINIIDKSAYISDKMVRFIDRINGNTHQIEIITYFIDEINQVLDDTESEFGLAEILHKMEEINHRNGEIIIPYNLIFEGLGQLPDFMKGDLLEEERGE